MQVKLLRAAEAGGCSVEAFLARTHRPSDPPRSRYNYRSAPGSAQVKLLRAAEAGGCSVEAFLAHVLEPPSSDAVSAAVRERARDQSVWGGAGAGAALQRCSLSSGDLGFAADELLLPSSPTPPLPPQVRALVCIGALDTSTAPPASAGRPASASASATTSASGGLTPLGRHLATLPVDVRVGKMLIYAAMLGCLDPVRVV